MRDSVGPQADLSPSAAHAAAFPNIRSAQIMKEDDANWPEPDRVGRQELEIVMGNEHISFTTSKIGEPGLSLAAALPGFISPRRMHLEVGFSQFACWLLPLLPHAGSLLDVQNSKDAEGLRVFYYLVQARAGAVPWPRSVRRKVLLPGGSVGRQLLPSCSPAGPEVLRLLAHLAALQDQADLTWCRRCRAEAVTGAECWRRVTGVRQRWPSGRRTEA